MQGRERLSLGVRTQGLTSLPTECEAYTPLVEAIILNHLPSPQFRYNPFTTCRSCGAYYIWVMAI